MPPQKPLQKIAQLVLILAGKSFLIHDFIIKHNLNCMFLTETWLDQGNCAAVHTDLSPPNLFFVSETRMHKKVKVSQKTTSLKTQVTY